MLKTYCSKVAKFVFILLVLPFFFATYKVYAQTSTTVNFQGKIVRNDTGHEGLNVTTGNPACVLAGQDTCDFQVKYYSAQSAGTLYLTETFLNKEIGDYGGVFNLSLGSGTMTPGIYSTLDQVINNSNSVYIEILFSPAGNETYTETFSRMPLQAAPYAIRSKYAGVAQGAFKFENAANATGYTGSDGMVYYDTTDGVLKLYSGGTWVPLATGSSGSNIWQGASISSFSHYPSQFLETTGIATLANFGVDTTENRAWVHGASSRTGFSVYSNYNGSTDWPLVTFKADASGFTSSILQLIQDGTGSILEGYQGSNKVFDVDNRGDMHLSSDGTLYLEPFTSLPSSSDLYPASGEGCLYSVGGNIYWDGACNGSSPKMLNATATSLWTDAGTFTYLTSTSDNLVLGGSTVATARFFFDMTAASGRYFKVDNYNNSETLFTIDSSGNIGIGTASPTHKLDIAGTNSSIANATGDITITPAQNLIISSGKVGIGTSTPSSLLSIGSSSQFQVDGSGDIVKIKGLTYSWPSAHTTNGVLVNNGSGTLSWSTVSGLGGVTGTGSSGQITFWNGTSSITGDNGFWWDNTNKRLGIGTSTPQASIDIAGATSEISNTYGNISILPYQSLVVTGGSTAPTAMWVYKTGSATSGDIFGLRIETNQTVAGALTVFGNRIVNRATHTSGTLAGLQANSTQIQLEGNGGTTNYVEGLTSNITVSTGAIASNVHLLRIFSPTNSGTINHLKGILINNMNAGSSSNYSIYSEGGTMYHAGNVGIGTSSPSGLLDVSNSFYTGTGIILVRPQDSSNEGGEIRLLGAGSNASVFIDNYAGILRILPSSGTVAVEVGGTVNAHSVFWGGSGSRTEARDDIGLRGDAGARSGFYEAHNPSPAANWYPGATGWQHFIDVRHSNITNNYALQIAGSFFNQELYFRKTANSPTTGWNKFVYADSNGNVSIANAASGATLTVGRAAGQPNIKSSTDWFMIDSTSNPVSINHYVAQNVLLAYGGGRVGIGMNGPSQKLDVAGSIRSTGHLFLNRGDPTIFLQDTDHRSAMVYANNNTFYILRGSGVNSTTWTMYNGQWPLEINLENNDALFGGKITSIGDVDVYKYITINKQASNAWFSFRQYFSSGTYIEVDTPGGYRGISTFASSQKYKKNIEDLEIDSNLIYSLRPVSFNWKTDTDDTPKTFGLIAEEVEQHIPELVRYRENGEILSVIYELISVLNMKELQKHERYIKEIQGTLAFIGTPVGNTNILERIENLEKIYSGKEENYQVEGVVVRGSLVSINTTTPWSVIAAYEGKDSIVGVVSTNPSAVMDADGGFQIGYATKPIYQDEKAPIALVGTAPTLVTSLNGQIEIGDSIGVSSLAGFGAKMTLAGYTVGKALERLDSNNCSSVSNINAINWPEDDSRNSLKPCYLLPDGTVVGKIMVAIQPSWFDPKTFVSIGEVSSPGWYRISQSNENSSANVKISNSTVGSLQNINMLIDKNNINTLSNFTSGNSNITKSRLTTVGNTTYLEIYIENVNNNILTVKVEGQGWSGTNISKVEETFTVKEYALEGVLLGVSDTFSVSKEGSLLTSMVNSDIGNSGSRWNDIYTKGTIRLGSGNSEGGIRYNIEKQRLEFSNDGINWIAMGDLTSNLVISPEYSGAILYADGSDNSGRMTSDALEENGSFTNYYEWKSDRDTLQDYDILVRIVLPDDFVSWNENAISLNFMTENSASVSNNKVEMTLIDSSGTDVEVKDGISKLPGVWERMTIKSVDIDKCQSAGQLCTLKLSLFSKDSYYSRVGDITLNYNRGL
ncbi:MAG: tail fiber domain-containing protein [Candidatus Dojkabacteria bacterium]